MESILRAQLATVAKLGLTMLYFAYGSNMSFPRLRARIHQARLLGVYVLPGHDLRFHKAGTDGSAKCDAYLTGSEDHTIEGVVFEVEDQGITALDHIEGVGYGYGRKEVTVFGDGGALQTVTYFATDLDPSMRPFGWYKQHVLVGARQAPLSPGYIVGIEAIQAKADDDHERARRELAIYP